MGNHDLSVNYKALGFELIRPPKVPMNPIVPSEPKYRTLDAQWHGDPPIGRSALDEREQA